MRALVKHGVLLATGTPLNAANPCKSLAAIVSLLPDTRDAVAQSVVGVAEDGMIGAKTIAAVEAMEVAEIVDQLCAVRLAFLQKLPTFATFGKGWSRRVAEVEDQARAFMS